MSPLRLPSVTLLRTQSDEKLVALARDGWEPAFAALVERHRREVLRGCARVLPEARAEDAAQQVFMAAWRALRRGDEVRDVRPWLLRIARNTALNALRVPGYDHAELADSLRATEAPQADLERREVVRKTLAGLAALPERQREALLRSAVEGASHAEIAAGLGIKEGAARQLVLRARTTLRSTATALTPAPVLTWALTRAGDVNVADAVAGGSAAGAAGLLAKAGVVAVVAGGAVATPVVVQRQHRAGPAAAQAAAADPAKADRQARRATVAATTTATATATATAAPAAHYHQRPAATPTAAPVRVEHRDSGGEDHHLSSGRDRSDDGDREPTTTAGSRHRDDDGVDDHSGSGSGSGDSEGPAGSGSDGHEGETEAAPTVTVTATPAPTRTSSADDGSGMSSGADDGATSGSDHLDGHDG